MWINGNPVGPAPFTNQNSSYNVYPVNPAVFDPSGTNFFAVKNADTQVPVVGADWVISMSCADGSQSYITNEDNSFWLYDDTTGASPPPNDGSGRPWYDPNWANPAPGTYFYETPVAITSSWWYTPMNNPITGQPLQVMSANASGADPTGQHVLYYREFVTLVEQPTPVPTPTYVPGCGPPTYVGGSILLAGPNGNNQPSFNAPITISSAVSGALVLVEIDNNGSPAISSMTFGGAPLTLWNSNASGLGGTRQMIYYMTAGGFSAGPQILSINFATNSSNQTWIVQAHIFSGVDLAAPLGAVASGATSNTPSFTDTLTTVGPIGLIMDFLENTQNNFPATLGPGQVYTGVTGSGSGLSAWCDYKISAAPGTYNMTYQWSPSGQTLESYQVEVNAPGCAGSPTPTPNALPSATPSPTSTRSPSPSPTFTPVPPGSSPTSTPTVTRTRTPSPTHSPVQPVNTPVPGAAGFRIVAVYPNPVSGKGCSFVVSVPSAMTVKFRVFDLRGELVWSGSQAFNGSGLFEHHWAAVNSAGADLSYGAYYLVATAGNDSDSKWLSIVR